MTSLASIVRPDPETAAPAALAAAFDSPAASPSLDEPAPQTPRRPPVPPLRLGDPLPDLPEEEAPAFAALRRDWEARLLPIDEAEQSIADTFACAAWRRRRLDAVDERVLRSLARGRVPVGMPSLDSLIRYRARLAKDAAELKLELRWLWQRRPVAIPSSPLSHGRREWCAEMHEKVRAARRAAAGPAAPEPTVAPVPDAPPSEPAASAAPPTSASAPPMPAAGPIAPGPLAGPPAGSASAAPARRGPSVPPPELASAETPVAPPRPAATAAPLAARHETPEGPPASAELDRPAFASPPLRRVARG